MSDPLLQDKEITKELTITEFKSSNRRLKPNHFFLVKIVSIPQ